MFIVRDVTTIELLVTDARDETGAALSSYFNEKMKNKTKRELLSSGDTILACTRRSGGASII